MNRKKYFGIAFGLAVSLLFLYLAFRGVDFDQAFVAMRNANYWYFIPSALALLIAFILRGFRWQTMMMPLKRISQANAFSFLMIGFMAVNILPLRMGEFVRPYLIGSKENISRTASLATVLLERIFDVVSLLMMMTITLFFSPNFPPGVRMFGITLGVLVVFLLIFLALLTFYQEKVVSLCTSIISIVSARLADKIGQLLEKFVDGLEVLKKGGHLLLITGYSVAIWFLTSYVFWFAGMAFGFKWGLMDASFVVVVTALGILLPGAPGFVGTFQFFCVKALEIVNVTDNATALSFSIVLNILQFGLVVSIGFLCLSKEGLNLTQLKEKENS